VGALLDARRESFAANPTHVSSRGFHQHRLEDQQQGPRAFVGSKHSLFLCSSEILAGQRPPDNEIVPNVLKRMAWLSKQRLHHFALFVRQDR
jgi:hypothetical protein